MFEVKPQSFIDGHTRPIPSDIAGVIFDMVGRRSWSAIAGVCHSWRSVIKAKMWKWIHAPNDLEIYTRPFIHLHSRIPQAQEIRLMVFTDDYDWRAILDLWFDCSSDFIDELEMYATSGDAPDNSICRDRYTSVAGELVDIWQHLVHHPPAALILLDKFIARLRENTNTVFHVGSVHHRVLFDDTQDYVTACLHRIMSNYTMYPHARIKGIGNSICGIHRELLVVMLVVIGDSFPRGTMLRSFLNGFIADTPITHADSRDAVEEFLSGE